MVKFLLTKARRNVVLRGNQGVGKTTLARVALTEIEQNEDWNSHLIVYTPRTDGKRAKDLLMKGLEPRRILEASLYGTRGFVH